MMRQDLCYTYLAGYARICDFTTVSIITCNAPAQWVPTSTQKMESACNDLAQAETDTHSGMKCLCIGNAITVTSVDEDPF